MASWHFTKYRVIPDNYTMTSATQPLVDIQPSKRSEYGAVDIDHVDATQSLGDTQPSKRSEYSVVDIDHVDAEKSTVPLKHRDTLHGSDPAGPAPNFARFHREPKSYLSYAILATIFCCLPLGIPAIYCATQAKMLARRGERISSYKAAHKSRQLIQMAVSIGLVLWFIALIVVIAVVHNHH